MLAEEPDKVRGRLRRQEWSRVAGWAGASLLAGCLFGGLVAIGTQGRDLGVVVFTVGIATFITGSIGALLMFPGNRLRRAQELIDLGLPGDALPLLKELSGEGQIEHYRSSACYLTGLSYQRQGATKLALAYYREYGKRFPEGPWSIEAKVHARELRRKDRELRSLAVEPREEDALRCPYCRDTLLVEKPHVECESCGTRYHDDCHADRGGCSVFGCASAPKAGRVPA